MYHHNNRIHTGSFGLRAYLYPIIRLSFNAFGYLSMTKRCIIKPFAALAASKPVRKTKKGKPGMIVKQAYISCNVLALAAMMPKGIGPRFALRGGGF